MSTLGPVLIKLIWRKITLHKNSRYLIG